jgi:hypothetical protein
MRLYNPFIKECNLSIFLTKLGLILVFALCTLWPALYNGYPLVYSDSGTYISSGFELKVPDDRPIMYGLIIRLFSLNISLWYVIIAQAIGSAVLIYTLIKVYVKSDKLTYIVFSISAFILMPFSGLPWYCSAILSDIYAAWSLLLLLLLLTQPYTIYKQLLLGLLLIVCNLTHFSNITTITCFGLVSIIMAIITNRKIINYLQVGIHFCYVVCKLFYFL